MDRAERRYRRHLKIRWRQRLYFTAAGYDWDRDHNYWWTEDGRLAKNNTRCKCLGCRYGDEWARPWEPIIDGDLDGYDHLLSKHNRIYRNKDPHPLLRRGAKSGTTIWKGKITWDWGIA